MKLILPCVAAILMFFLWPAEAADGSQHLWIPNFTNGRGISCCGAIDTARISNVEAAEAKIGTKIIVRFPSGPDVVVVNAIYQTRDPKGRAYITRYGCLFRWNGG